jgi:hypothetical protein
MSALDDFDVVVGDVVAPALREWGFRRRRTTFRRRSGEAWQIVNLQKSKWSARERVEFTVNLGVALDALAGDPPAWASRGWPLEYECHFRMRLAALGEADDRWESLGRWRDSRRRTARRVLDGLSERGVPWLDLYSDPALLLAHIADEPERLELFDPSSLVELAAIRETSVNNVQPTGPSSWRSGARLPPRKQRAGEPLERVNRGSASHTPTAASRPKR